MTRLDLLYHGVRIHEEMLALGDGDRVVHVTDARNKIAFQDPREALYDAKEIRFAHRVTGILVEMAVRIEIAGPEEPVLENRCRSCAAYGLADVADKGW